MASTVTDRVLAQDPRAQRSFLDVPIVLALIGLGVFFGLWALAGPIHLAPPRFLPSPAAVATEIVVLTHEPYAGSLLQGHIAASLAKFGASYALAVAIGVPLGLFLGQSRFADRIISPLFDAVRFIPPIAWVPFSILWFGTGPLAPTLVVFAGAFSPCVVNAYRGARFVDRTMLEAAQTLGASRYRILREIIVPAALPSIVAGMRISAGIGWQSLIGAELIVGSTGLGFMIVSGEGNLTTSVVMAGMATIGIIGVFIDLVLRTLENRITRNWNPS
ncbi:MAG TPA: ABC transporter permease [Candidatus Acidoferrales bacterium]|nr:ABC transporter permease [Candidatus Acidoferrales bacterium]